MDAVVRAMNGDQIGNTCDFPPTVALRGGDFVSANLRVELATGLPSGDYPFQTAFKSVTSELKVAFIGDQGLTTGSRAVLQLIRDEEADLLIHQGYFDYIDDPERWDRQINEILGPDFPYFASIGNHDVAAWPGYQQRLQARLDRIDSTICTGDLGVRSSCTYQDLFFILSGAGTMGADHEIYIRNWLNSDNSTWRVCSWHKN